MYYSKFVVWSYVAACLNTFQSVFTKQSCSADMAPQTRFLPVSDLFSGEVCILGLVQERCGLSSWGGGRVQPCMHHAWWCKQGHVFVLWVTKSACLRRLLITLQNSFRNSPALVLSRMYIVVNSLGRCYGQHYTIINSTRMNSNLRLIQHSSTIHC